MSKQDSSSKFPKNIEIPIGDGLLHVLTRQGGKEGKAYASPFFGARGSLPLTDGRPVISDVVQLDNIAGFPEELELVIKGEHETLRLVDDVKVPYPREKGLVLGIYRISKKKYVYTVTVTKTAKDTFIFGELVVQEK